MVVIKDKDSSLKNINHHLIVLGQEVCLKLKVSMIEQPEDFSVLELIKKKFCNGKISADVIRTRMRAMNKKKPIVF